MQGEIVSAIAGFFVGILISILPSFHPNNISQFASAFPEPQFFLIALYASSVVLGAIASALLLVPDATTKAMPLPIHRFVLKGKAGYAIILILCSMALASIVSIIVSPFLFALYKKAQWISAYSLIIIACFAAYSILAEKRVLYALVYFLLSGLAGYLAFDFLSEPFLPMFSGLFGVPALLLAGKKVSKVSVDFSKPVFFSAASKVLGSLHLVFVGIVLAFFADLIPAISSDSQLAFMALVLISSSSDLIILLSTISVAHLFTTLVALSSISAKKTGLSVAYSMFGIPGAQEFLSLLLFVLLSISLAYFFIIFISRLQISNFSAISLAFLIGINFLANGFAGIFVLAVFSAIGYLPHALGVKRFLGMGCLIVPVLLKAVL